MRSNETYICNNTQELDEGWQNVVLLTLLQKIGNCCDTRQLGKTESSSCIGIASEDKKEAVLKGKFNPS
jgi:hypothetical protein